MQTQTNGSSVLAKTRELCETILADSEVSAIRRQIDAFLADDAARGQYDAVVSRGQALQEKQQRAQPLSGQEVSEFESQRDALLRNPVARNFLDAQEKLHDLQHSIQHYVSKTLQLGRVPTAEDMEEGSCGHGCGCHH